jgi:NADP-dependent 3-hydroxy acid dehydrogenase YdfG
MAACAIMAVMAWIPPLTEPRPRSRRCCTNLKGAWIVGRRVIPHMIAAGQGVIINNSSIAGL